MQIAAPQNLQALNHGFDGFLDYLHDQEAGASTLSPMRFGDVLRIEKFEFGEEEYDRHLRTGACPPQHH